MTLVLEVVALHSLQKAKYYNSLPLYPEVVLHLIEFLSLSLFALFFFCLCSTMGTSCNCHLPLFFRATHPLQLIEKKKRLL